MMTDRDRGRGRDTGRRGRPDEDDDNRGSRSSSRGGGRGESRGGGSGRYRYTPRSADNVNKRSTQGGGDFDRYIKDSIKMFKANDGDNTLRILPPTWDNPEHFGYDVHVHFGIGPDEQAYLCLEKMKGEKCPICEERKRAVHDGDEKYADTLKPMRRVLIAVIDRDNEKEGPQAWAMPWGIDRDLCKLVIDKKSGEVLPIDDPENGYDIEFSKQGSGIKTKYVGLAIARRESDLGNEKWLDFMVDNPLPDCLQYYTFDHIQNVFGGGSSNSRGNNDDDDLTQEQERDLRKAERGEGRNGGRRSTRGEDDYSWDDVHGMTFEELKALIDDKDLNIDPEESKDDDELADWVCEDLKIVKEEVRATRRRTVDNEDDNNGDRMEKLRSRRTLD